MSEIINPLTGHFLIPGNWRRTPTPWGTEGAGILIDGSFFVQPGSIVLDAIAIALSPEYADVQPSGFQWKSGDGVCFCFNETAFSGGELYDSGAGSGTDIAIEPVYEPGFLSALRPDTEV